MSSNNSTTNSLKPTSSIAKLSCLNIETKESNTLSKKLTFVESLSQKLEDESQRDLQALNYITNFKNNNFKIDLLNKLYQIFNETIFENKLPSDTLLIWNPKLTSSGGYCKKVIQNKVSSIQIHISVRICDTPGTLKLIYYLTL